MPHGTTLPTQLGIYTLNHSHHIGRGRHGEVCMGLDTSTNVQVAVKRVKRVTSEQRRIQRELDTLRAISHPNIIDLLHYASDDHHDYFFLELCDFDLQSFAQEKGSEFASLKLRFIQDSSLAVECLHGKNIIHRDLKPENILVKEVDGTWILKVTDFGLARRIPDGAGSRSFSASADRGTRAYMAPEVLPTDGHARYSKPADIFSLGLVHLSIIEHTGGPQGLQPKTVDGQTLAQWVRDEQLRRGVEAVEVPSLCTGEERWVVRTVKGLCQRMVRFLPAERCKIADVLAELHRIRQRLDNGESYPDAPTGSDATSPGHLPPTTLHSAEMTSSSHPSGATFPSPALQSAQLEASSSQHQSTSATLPSPELQSMDVAEQNTSRIHAHDVILVQLHRHAMPFKPHKAIINFGLGQELEALWLESQMPDHLHYAKYRDGVWEEVWTKELPDEQQWNCRKFVSSACMLLQSINKTVCFYDPETLEPSSQSSSPGWVVGLTGQGRAVVGNHASPTVAYQGVTLHVCELESLQKPVVTLRLPEDKTYDMEGLICASGASDGHVAVINFKNYVDLFAPDGHHISRVDLPGQTRRPSCTTRHVFVPVRREPPTIAVISWRGEIERVLGAAELGLGENEWCWSISPTHDGKFNVLVTDAEYQDFIVTYQIEA